MAKYNVGDELLLKVRVEEVDEDDSSLTYGSNDQAIWFGDKDVLAVVSSTKPEPVRLTVGDYVTCIGEPERGVGKIIVDDHSELPYRVEWPDGYRMWLREDRVKRAEKPADPVLRFAVGDYVTASDHHADGVGKVIGLRLKKDGSPYGCPYRVEWPDGKRDIDPEDWLTKAQKPAKFAVWTKVTDSDHPGCGVGTITKI